MMSTVHNSADLFIDAYLVLTLLCLFELQRVFQEAEQTAHAWWVASRLSKEPENHDVEDLSSEATSEPIANLDWLDFGENRVSLV